MQGGIPPKYCGFDEIRKANTIVEVMSRKF